jgi:hypothetical protein
VIQGAPTPPVILAAGHADDSKRFSACFQLHALFNLVKPNVGALATSPLFPTRAQGPNFSPYYTYEEGLGKLVRRVMAWVFRCRESDACSSRILLTPCVSAVPLPCTTQVLMV